MDLSHFFRPVGKHAFERVRKAHSNQLAGRLTPHTTSILPEPRSGDVVMLGVKTSPEDDAPDWIRHYLYALKAEADHERLIDAGDFDWDKHDTTIQAHLQSAFEQLLAQGATVMVLGGGQEITKIQFEALAKQDFAPRLVLVDAYPDIAVEKDYALQSHTFLSHVLDQSEVPPKDLSLLAYQFPLVSDQTIELLKDRHFELCRLSELRNHFEGVEPAMRASHLFSFDVGSIRQSDAPGSHHPLPSGLFAEEACRLAKLAGLSSAVQCGGFYEFNSAFDYNGQTANLIAQAIWYFLEGHAERYQEHPLLEEKDFFKYKTSVTSSTYQLVFFKSKRTGRWWMALPADANSTTYGPIVPCTYEDYLAATQDHLPDRWLRNLQKHW
jgi:formiminoglutamase